MENNSNSKLKTDALLYFQTGHYIPQLAELMIQFNKKEKLFNLKGIAVSSPLQKYPVFHCKNPLQILYQLTKSQFSKVQKPKSNPYPVHFGF